MCSEIDPKSLNVGQTLKWWMKYQKFNNWIMLFDLALTKLEFKKAKSKSCTFESSKYVKETQRSDPNFIQIYNFSNLTCFQNLQGRSFHILAGLVWKFKLQI